MTDLPEYVQRNRSAWDSYAPDYAETGHRAWAGNEPSWGIFDVPEADLGVLPATLDGLDVVELGCGTAYVSPGPAWRSTGGHR